MAELLKETRPWGNYKVLLQEPGFQVKRIEVSPGARLSLQKHLKRAERWTIATGEGVATVGTDQVRVSVGSFVEVRKGQVHRIQNTGTIPLIFIEVQLGRELDENDIVRLEDDFGRA